MVLVFGVDIRSCKAYGQARAKRNTATRGEHYMGEKEKKLDYVRPKLEEMSREGTTGGRVCDTGSANVGACTNGTSAGTECDTGTGNGGP